MSEAETGAQSGAGGTTTQSGGAGGSESTSGTGTDANAGTQGGATTGQTAGDDDKVSRSDYDTVTKRMQAADQRAAKFEQELQALKTKDLPEAERLKAEHEALSQQVSKLREVNRKLTLETAFFKDNTHEWQNPSAALKMIDLSGVNIDDEGHVTGLKDALKKLANAEPWMLKPKSAATGGTGGSAGATNGAAGTTAGVPPMTGQPGTNQPAKPSTQRFPALQSRQRPSPS